MALLGNVTSSSNSVASYHVIRSYNWDKFKSISINVWSYLDSNARQDMKEPVMIRTYEISNEPAIDDITLSFLYDQLKLMSDFNNMVDG